MENRIPNPVTMRGLYYNGTREELKSAISYVGKKENECVLYPLPEKDYKGNLKPEGQRYAFAFSNKGNSFYVNPGDILIWGIFGEFYVVHQTTNWKTDWEKRKMKE